MTFIPSPAVRAMLSLRMDAAHGTPTVWQKIVARLGFGAAIGMTPAEIASTLAGDNRDLTQGETDLLSLFANVLHTGEADGLADLQAAATTALSGASGVTSVAAGVALVKTVLTTASASAQSQAATLGETTLTTLVSAILSSLGHTNLPAA
jgi:hypothetical protein